jgi:hypothetical protein
MAFIRSWPSPVDLHFITGKFTGGIIVWVRLAAVQVLATAGAGFEFRHESIDRA